MRKYSLYKRHQYNELLKKKREEYLSAEGIKQRKIELDQKLFDKKMKGLTLLKYSMDILCFQLG